MKEEKHRSCKNEHGNQLAWPKCAGEFFSCRKPKLPAVYRHYKKYLWVRDLTVKENEL